MRRDKRKAAQAWRNALKRSDAETICAAAERYRDDRNRDAAFTKYPASWLNASSWEDEDPIPARPHPNGPVEPTRLSRLEEEELIRRAVGDSP